MIEHHIRNDASNAGAKARRGHLRRLGSLVFDWDYNTLFRKLGAQEAQDILYLAFVGAYVERYFERGHLAKLWRVCDRPPERYSALGALEMLRRPSPSSGYPLIGRTRGRKKELVVTFDGDRGVCILSAPYKKFRPLVRKKVERLLAYRDTTRRRVMLTAWRLCARRSLGLRGQ